MTQCGEVQKFSTDSAKMVMLMYTVLDF